jgi:hypothetical protein
VTPLGRKFVALAFVACFEVLTSACGSRTPPASVPQQPQSQPAPPVESPRIPPSPEPSSSPAPTDPRPEPDPLECAVITEPGGAITTVALTERVEPSNAPYPTNESERLLFRQLYETLVRVDCNGGARPGLAAAWRLDIDGRGWLVTLREDAQFSDGTPVTPLAVRASWTGGGDQLRPHVSRLVESIVPIDDRTLAITLRRQHADAPRVLAHTDLAIAKAVAAGRWPLGTRPDRAAPEDDASRATTDSVITLARHNGPSVRFVIAPGDPRNLLDQGVDLLVTRDPATLSYAAPLSQFQSVSLAWQRTRVLVTPGRPRTAPPLSDEARQALAADAVRGDARGAVGPFWWETLQACTVRHEPRREQTTLIPRIVYDANDPAARDLAERLVALSNGSAPAARAMMDAFLPDRPRRRYERAVGLTGEPLARARRVGNDAGYIMSFDNRPLDPCREIEVVTDSARWLDPETIVPLIDTRLHAIVRRGRSGVTAEWDGGLLIAGATGPK